MAAKVAAEVAVVATEATVESLNIQDSLIDAAEIQAAYLNTNTILSQNCVIEGDIANLQADSDLDSLKLSIEPTDHSKTAFRVETGIDLVIDCYKETKEKYRTQPFTRTEISEGNSPCKVSKACEGFEVVEKERRRKRRLPQNPSLHRYCKEGVTKRYFAPFGPSFAGNG